LSSEPEKPDEGADFEDADFDLVASAT